MFGDDSPQVTPQHTGNKPSGQLSFGTNLDSESFDNFANDFTTATTYEDKANNIKGMLHQQNSGYNNGGSVNPFSTTPSSPPQKSNPFFTPTTSQPQPTKTQSPTLTTNPF